MWSGMRQGAPNLAGVVLVLLLAGEYAQFPLEAPAYPIEVGRWTVGLRNDRSRSSRPSCRSRRRATPSARPATTRTTCCTRCSTGSRCQRLWRSSHRATRCCSTSSPASPTRPVRALEKLGVKYVVLHRGDYGEDRSRRLSPTRRRSSRRACCSSTRVATAGCTGALRPAEGTLVSFGVARTTGPVLALSVATLLLILAGEVAPAGAAGRVVSRAEILAAMHGSAGFDPTATTTAPGSSRVPAELLRASSSPDPESAHLFVDHRDWYAAFLERTHLAAARRPCLRASPSNTARTWRSTPARRSSSRRCSRDRPSAGGQHQDRVAVARGRQGPLLVRRHARHPGPPSDQRAGDAVSPARLRRHGGVRRDRGTPRAAHRRLPGRSLRRDRGRGGPLEPDDPLGRRAPGLARGPRRDPSASRARSRSTPTAVC